MNILIINSSFLTEISNVIRQKNNTNSLIPLADIPAKVEELPIKEGTYAWKKSDSNGNFIEYITSNSETEYPSNGQQGDFFFNQIVNKKTVYVWKKEEKKTTTTTQSQPYTYDAYYPNSTVIYLTIPSGLILTEDDISGLSMYPQGLTMPDLTLLAGGYAYMAGEIAGEWSYTTGNSYINFPYPITGSFPFYGSKTVYRNELVTDTITTNLGEVTSENRNAYPDNGKHTDGYYYTYIGERLE